MEWKEFQYALRVLTSGTVAPISQYCAMSRVYILVFSALDTSMTLCCLFSILGFVSFVTMKTTLYAENECTCIHSRSFLWFSYPYIPMWYAME